MLHLNADSHTNAGLAACDIFLPTIPLLGGGMPNMTLGSDNQQSN